jgi:hypothetical protein
MAVSSMGARRGLAGGATVGRRDEPFDILSA